jgi:hypothetical protein
MCATAQYLAWQNCECYGVQIPGLDEEYTDPNPACKLCVGSNLDCKNVPMPNYSLLTNTGGYGKMNCLGLEQALAEGVFMPSACSTVQRNSAKTCCNYHID